LKVPSIGRTVHYVSPGSADHRYPPAHRAAVITELDGGHTPEAGLTLLVFNPTGIHHAFHVPFDPTGLRPYSWHWPEYVPEVPDDE
jgi:hypothetical protein